MTLEELIEQGPKVKEKCISRGGMETISGEEYSTWLMNCSQKLLSDFPDNPLTNDFIERAKNANGNFSSEYDKLMGILKSFEGIETNKTDLSIDCILSMVLNRFHKMARSIKNRHANRSTLLIKDEYDVQDLLQGILRLFVDDVRPEDNTPSYAGGNSRIDFHLPEYDMYIETKMTREGLTDRKIGEELLIDIGRYKNSCSTLVCFIYDPKEMLDNPYGLIKDLEKLSTEDLTVKVFVNP